MVASEIIMQCMHGVARRDEGGHTVMLQRRGDHPGSAIEKEEEQRRASEEEIVKSKSQSSSSPGQQSAARQETFGTYVL
jgi:hypothetical protein